MTFEKWVCRFCKILFFNRASLNDDADADADAINGTNDDADDNGVEGNKKKLKKKSKVK